MLQFIDKDHDGPGTPPEAQLGFADRDEANEAWLVVYHAAGEADPRARIMGQVLYPQDDSDFEVTIARGEAAAAHGQYAVILGAMAVQVHSVLERIAQGEVLGDSDLGLRPGPWDVRQANYLLYGVADDPADSDGPPTSTTYGYPRNPPDEPWQQYNGPHAGAT